jgi:hypothetical protein
MYGFAFYFGRLEFNLDFVVGDIIQINFVMIAIRLGIYGLKSDEEKQEE